ncbi:MAG: hypothetical protein R3F07_05895 [Opitutaceae bacterium]
MKERDESVTGAGGWSPAGRKRGFALILTISLLTFLILLLVSVAALTKVEYAVDRNSQSYARARQNAVLGLNTALGQLQQYAGPDQRVTARAEILDADPDTPQVHEDGVYSPNWTGVWDAAAAAAGPLTWLVSGNEVDGAPTALAPTVLMAEPAFDNENIWLLHNTVFYDSSYVDPESDPRIIVRRVPIQSGGIPGLAPGEVATFGHYAYWVGDEGVKASIRSLRPVDVSGNRRQDWDQQRRPRVRYEDVFAEISGPESVDTIASLSKLTTPNQLAFVDSITRAIVRRRFHESTVESFGLLVNTDLGGLKADLSDPASLDPQAAWFALAPISPPGVDIDLPEFHTAPFAWSGVDLSSAVDGPVNLVAPVVSELELVIQFDFPLFPIPDLVNVTFQVEFWNPYGADLLLGPSDLRFEFRNLPDFEIVHGFGNSRLDSMETINSFPGETAAVLVVPVAGGIDLGGGKVLVVSGTPLSVSGSPLSGISPRNSSGAVFNVLPSSTMTTVPHDGSGFRPIEIVGRLGSEDSDPVFFRQVVNPPVSLTSSSARYHHWRLSSRIRDPSGYDDADPYQDPRQLGLKEGATGDLLRSTSVLLGDGSSTDFNTTDDLLNDGDRVVLFDLPMRTNLSLGALQNIPEYRSVDGENTPILEWGNLYGADKFSTLDELFVSSFNYGADSSASVSLDDFEGTVYFRPILSASGELPTNGDIQDHAAANLLVSGMFNINSTSFLAWRAAVGGSFFDGNWRYWDGSSVVLTNMNRAFFRLPHTGSNLGAAYVLNPEGNPWIQGVHEIENDGQVDEMARFIVEAIKTRGRPFGSLQEFAASGILEQAIAAVGSEPDPYADPPTNPSDLPLNPDVSDLPFFATSRLTQADVLGNLAPFLSARSDTFLIRAYGDAVNPITGLTEARAWCEALVQRLPEYVDPTENRPWEAPTGVNATFGRRFEIVYFRWLSPDDI